MPGTVRNDSVSLFEEELFFLWREKLFSIFGINYLINCGHLFKNGEFETIYVLKIPLRIFPLIVINSIIEQ